MKASVIALGIAVCVAAALAGGRAGPVAATATATCPKPLGLTLTRKPGKSVGLLRWRLPRSGSTGLAGFRVFRNGKVVGQTRGRTFRVKVPAGATSRFLVRPALRNGKLLPCRAQLVRRIRWRPPTRPLNLAVRPADDGVVVSWERSARGDGKLAGYRVFRDNVPVRQTKAPSLRLALPQLRRYVLTVAAVDTRGKLSRRSAPVSVLLDHAAPPAPEGLTGEALTDRSVILRWRPSPGTGGARVSYRVLRNERVVGQTSVAAAEIANLAPAASYSFTVVAVDSLGYASGASAPVVVRTKEPEQSTGNAHVFLLASTGRSFEAFQRYYRQIDTIYPTYFNCQPDGSFTGQDDPLITNYARLRGVKVHARFNCQRTATLTTILRTPEVRQAAIDRIAQEAAGNGYEGINLDFEAGAAGDRAAYSSFVADVAARLHADGRALSVDVSAKVRDVPNHPRSTFFDYDALSASADTVFVMAWGIHWSTSKPGAIDDYPWAQQVADYVAARPRKERYVLGFGMYGFDWPNGGGTGNPATPLEHEDVLKLAASVGASPQYDSVARAPFFSYVDGGGSRHDVWFTNGQSIGERIDLARSRGLGIGLWRLGREDPGIWQHPALQPGAPWP